MKKIFLSSLIIFNFQIFTPIIFAQSFNWANNAGGNLHDEGYDISTDENGNSYIIGIFSGTSTFGTFQLVSYGGYDIFIAKYDVSGNCIWARNAGGTADDHGRSIYLDENGNIYLTGWFVGSATFGTIQLNSYSSIYDAFIAKYDMSGNCIWVKNAGGLNSWARGFGISLDANGNAFLTGSIAGTVSFGTIQLTSNGGSDVFIAKYDANGNCVWAKNAGGASLDYGNSISVETNGNAYITGNFEGTATFGTIQLVSYGYGDIFIAKYDASGNCTWAKKGGGNSDDYGLSISIDASGNTYLTGSFQGTATFGTIQLNSYGSSDIVIIKYDQSGNCLWAKKAGGNSYDVGYGILTDTDGNSYVTGSFSGTATFNSIQLLSYGSRDIFIAKYDANGNCVWVKNAGGVSDESGRAVAIDANRNTYVTGTFQETATFGTIQLVSYGDNDIFIAAIGDENDYQVFTKINPAYFFYDPEFYNHNDPLGNVILQNKIAFEVEIFSSIHYDPPLQNLEVQVLLDGQPMSLVLQSSLANLDSVGDGVIDRLPSSWRPNLDYIKFLAVSNDTYTENQLEKNITVKILSIDGQPFNSVTEEVLDYYFAKNTSQLPFKENVDGYGFNNDIPFNFADFRYYMLQVNWFPVIGGIGNFIYEFWAGKGRCYGMAATSGTYFVDPSRKPLAGNVNLFPVNNFNVQDNINRSHLSQGYYSLFMGSNQDLNTAYQISKNELLEHRPVLFGIRESGKDKHAVLATSLSYFHNKNLAGLRVYENENHNNAWSNVIDFNQQKFIYPIKPTWNELLSVPVETYSNWDFGYYFNQALSNIIQLFFNGGKKGYSVACPVYLLVENTSGQKSGYTAEGIFLNEIPNAEVKRIPTYNATGDSITIVYVPVSDNYNVEINSYDSGQMLFESMKPETQTSLITFAVDSIQLTNQTICYYNDNAPSNFLIDWDGDGNIDTTIVVTQQIITEIDDDQVVSAQIPSQFMLKQNYPNPFNSSTKISFEIPKQGNVIIKVYDVLGNEVSILVNEEKPVGTYELNWNAANLPSGVYFYRIQAGDFVETKKMIYLK